MVKHGWDYVWSLPTERPCCSSPIVFHLFVKQSEPLRCWCASHLLSLLSCHLSCHCWSVNCLLYPCTFSLACRCLLWDLRHDIAMAPCAARMRKLVYPIINMLRTDIHTYKHNLSLVPRLPCSGTRNWSCAGVESLVFFVTWKAQNIDAR